MMGYQLEAPNRYERGVTVHGTVVEWRTSL
jgi:hypothetical protein